MNTLNLAVISRTEKGNLSYCNEFGLQLIKQIPSGDSSASHRMREHLQKLKEMELTVKNFLRPPQNEIIDQKERQILQDNILILYNYESEKKNSE